MQSYKVSKNVSVSEWVSECVSFLSFHSLTQPHSQSITTTKRIATSNTMKSLKTKQTKNWHTTISFAFTHRDVLLHIYKYIYYLIWNGQRTKVRTVGFSCFIFFTKFNIHIMETNFTQKLKKKREIIPTNNSYSHTHILKHINVLP